MAAYSSSQEDAQACTLKCGLCGSAILLIIFSLLGFAFFYTVNAPSDFYPDVLVVSAFVSRIDVADGSRLNATWAIVLEVQNDRLEFAIDSIQSGVLQVGDSQNLLATTQWFVTNKPVVADRTGDVRQTVAIQIKANGEAVAGLDSREMEEANRVGWSEFGFLALVRAHFGPKYFFHRKNYFARFTCHPLWIGSLAEQIAGDLREANPKKCHVDVIRQEHLDENWTRLDMG